VDRSLITFIYQYEPVVPGMNTSKPLYLNPIVIHKYDANHVPAVGHSADSGFIGFGIKKTSG
jgi:hypothetical protein